MRVLVTGANGMLGHRVVDVLRSRATATTRWPSMPFAPVTSRRIR